MTDLRTRLTLPEPRECTPYSHCTHLMMDQSLYCCRCGTYPPKPHSFQGGMTTTSVMGSHGPYSPYNLPNITREEALFLLNRAEAAEALLEVFKVHAFYTHDSSDPVAGCAICSDKESCR